MPIPIFEQQTTAQLAEQLETKKEKISPWSIFFSILLTAVLITIGEFGLRDSNRVFNPYYETCYVKISFSSINLFQRVGAPQTSCDLKAYEGTSLLLHADIVAPLLLIGLAIIFIIRKKKLASYIRVIFLTCAIFVVWMSIRIIYETESFLVKHYPLAGKYVVFLTIAAVCALLIITIQNKIRQKPAA
jgi:hypothetical protein